MSAEVEETEGDSSPVRQPTQVELVAARNFIEKMYELGATEVSVGVVFVRFPQRRAEFVPYGKAG